MFVKCVVNIMPTKLFGSFNKGTLRMRVLTSPWLYVCPSMFVHIQFERCRNILMTLSIRVFYCSISILSYIRCLDRLVSTVNRLRTRQPRNISFLGRRNSIMGPDRTCSPFSPLFDRNLVLFARNKACSSTYNEGQG
jgi:hypothetical protein